MIEELSEEFKKELYRYVEEISRIRREYIQSLLIEYFERVKPDPEDVVLVEEHTGLRTIWYFSTKEQNE